MKKLHFNTGELDELHMAHRDERNKKAAYKINAVILFGIGWNLKEVKEALLLDDETLRSYLKKYQSGGLPELLKTNYSGRQPCLDEQQMTKLCSELDNNIYLTTCAVIEYVADEFNVKYSISGMRDLLHRAGYSYKKPKLVPGNPDREAQEDFVSYYEQFMEGKSDGIEVFFIDAVHPEHNTMAAYGWIKKGEKHPLKTNSGRQRLNLHGAINADSMDVIIIESESINRDSTTQLLDVIDRKYCYAKEIIIILDNARYHYSKEVTALVEKSPRLKLVYLPTYSPELNLIERVWRFFKKNVLYNKYYENLAAFRKASISFFRNIDKYHDELASLLDGGFEGHNFT